MTYGVHGDDLVTWSAKAAADPESAMKAVGAQYEIVLGRSRKGYTARVMHGGKPIQNVVFETMLPGGRSATELHARADGMADLPPFKDGLLALGAIVSTGGPGDYKGKPYKDQKEMVSLTVRFRSSGPGDKNKRS